MPTHQRRPTAGTLQGLCAPPGSPGTSHHLQGGASPSASMFMSPLPVLHNSGVVQPSGLDWGQAAGNLEDAKLAVQVCACTVPHARLSLAQQQREGSSCALPRPSRSRVPVISGARLCACARPCTGRLSRSWWTTPCSWTRRPTRAPRRSRTCSIASTCVLGKQRRNGVHAHLLARPSHHQVPLAFRPVPRRCSRSACATWSLRWQPCKPRCALASGGHDRLLRMQRIPRSTSTCLPACLPAVRRGHIVARACIV